jgi:uncharacterized membrane protein YfcA
MEIILSLLLGTLASSLQGDKTKEWKKWKRFALAFFGCFLAGLYTTLFSVLRGGEFEIDLFLNYLALSFTASQTYYNLYFKNIVK